MKEAPRTADVAQGDERGDGWAWTDWISVGRQRWRRLGRKFWRVPKDIKRQRTAICRECEEYVAATTQCRQCHCAMGIKGWLAESACPLGKWPAVTPPRDADPA